MISKGKEILKSKGILTDIFMAPSHSFDKNTLRALKSNGFYIITDGFGTEPYRENGIIFYPISMQRSSSLKDKRDGIVTFVYHANTMDENDFKNLKKLLSTDKVVSFSDYSKFDTHDRAPLEGMRQYVLAIGKRTLVNIRKHL
jgi:hypothetical protein